jgi:hypothetical protein
MADRSSERALPSPGTSPFHVKGIVYQGTHLFFEEKVRGGVSALYHEIRDDQLLAFIEQRFLPSSWYDVLPIARLIKHEARAMRLSVPHYLRLRTRYQAEKDIGSVYKFLLKLVSLDQVALRVPRIVGQIFDFGEANATMLDHGHVALHMKGLPTVLVEWCSTAFDVYVDTALKMSGAKETEIVLQAGEAEGKVQGVDCITLKMDVRYV